MADWNREVEALEKAEEEFRVSSRPNVVDEVVGNEMTRVRGENSRNGISLATPEAFDQYEKKYRMGIDAELSAKAIKVDALRKAIAAELDAAIEKSQILPSMAQQHGAGTQAFLLARLLDEAEYTRVLDDLQNRTLTQLTDFYERLKDDEHNAPVRAIEAAFREGRLDRFRLTPDPAADAIAVTKLQNAIKARRTARIPPALLEARDRVKRTESLEFTFKRDHLASGRGVAVRPVPAVITGVF